MGGKGMVLCGKVGPRNEGKSRQWGGSLADRAGVSEAAYLLGGVKWRLVLGKWPFRL